jgi:hypothetical protein
MKRLALISLLFLSSTLSGVLHSSAQQQHSATSVGGTTIPSKPASQIDAPVVYGTKNDGYPKKIVAQGVITQLNFAPGYCGWVWHSGTLKLEVAKTSGDYKDKYLYLVVPCLLDPSRESEYLNKKICVSVGKLNHDSLTGPIANNIDSNGTPFYLLMWNSGSKKSFLKQVSCD